MLIVFPNEKIINFIISGEMLYGGGGGIVFAVCDLRKARMCQPTWDEFHVPLLDALRISGSGTTLLIRIYQVEHS